MLYGVYAYLKALGCRFLRQGGEGDYVPQTDIYAFDCELSEKPALRFRGYCIEGAVSLRNMLDNIDWAAKNGVNSYFIEFSLPWAFFERYYTHRLNPLRESEGLTIGQVEVFHARMISEIKKRGMLLHSMGHGWTCEALGIDAFDWEKTEAAIPRESRALMAEIDGVRGLYGGVAINTNLCYGNEKVRELLSDSVVSYAMRHPETDMLQFWLADGGNNQCECELCRDTRPSDFFVMILNLIDKKLTRAGLGTHVVFLNYSDLLWAPERNVIEHPERFVMLFAPISRSYSQSYKTAGSNAKCADYKRNALSLPKSVAENLAYLRDWKKAFGGDVIAYEYHFMWDCYADPASYCLTKVLSEDIAALEGLGIRGIIEDQSQRCFFPTGFAQFLYCGLCRNPSLSRDDAADEYFEAAFGGDGGVMREFYEKVSERFDPVYLRGEKHGASSGSFAAAYSDRSSEIDAEAEEKLSEITGLCEKIRPVVERGLRNETDEARRRSWVYSDYALRVFEPLSQALALRAGADDRENRLSAAREKWNEAKKVILENERDLESALDVFEFMTVLAPRFEEA